MIGASGLHPFDGAGTTELLETAIKREWIRRAKRVCLLADSGKWQQHTAIQFAAWKDFTEFYTDKKPPADFRNDALKVVTCSKSPAQKRSHTTP